MLAVHRPRAARPLLVACALLLPLLGPAAPARADDGVTAGDTVVGELVQAWPEFATPREAARRGDDAPLSWIDTGDGDSVRVDTDDVAHLQAGATVRVKVGDEVAGSAVSGAEPAREVLSAQVLEAADVPPTAPASAPYTDEVTVALVLPPGAAPDGTTVSGLVSRVNGPVADFWQEQSNGSIRIHASAGAPGWISARYGCETWQAPYLWNEVADDVGFTPGPGRHLLLYVPGYPSSLPGCAYGLAEVGSGPTAGGNLYVRGTATSVIAHELGHNLGLGHSSELQCDRTLDIGTCRTWSYNDLYDVMGASWDELGSLNVVQAASIGLLPAGQRQTVTPYTPSASYTLAPVSGRSGIRGLMLTGTDGTQYWLEYRPAAGQDWWLGDSSSNWPRLLPGVLLRRAGSASGDSSLLLDATPSPVKQWAGDSAQALQAGTTLSLSGGPYNVTVQGTTAAAATVRVSNTISDKYTELAGSGRPLGSSTSSVICGLRAGGCYQGFAGGTVYWSPASGAHLVTGEPVGQRWAAQGWEAGPMGYPTTDPVCGLTLGGCFQHFEAASIFSSSTGGVHAVWGAIRSWWWAHGSETGTAGYPTTEEICGLRSGGCYQGFTKGTVYWSPATGAHFVAAPVAARWAAQGWEAGPMGYPVSDTTCGLADGGCYQLFQVGSIYSTASTGAHVVWGAILQRWAAQGWETGPAGYPTSDESCDSGGCRQQFRGAVISWSPAAGTRLTSR